MITYVARLIEGSTTVAEGAQRASLDLATKDAMLFMQRRAPRADSQVTVWTVGETPPRRARVWGTAATAMRRAGAPRAQRFDNYEWTFISESTA